MQRRVGRSAAALAPCPDENQRTACRAGLLVHESPLWPVAAPPLGRINRAIPVTFVAFDLLPVNGHDVCCNPWADSRALLEELWQERPCAPLADVFDDGPPCSRRSSSPDLRGSSPATQWRVPARLPRLDKDQEPVYWRRNAAVARTVPGGRCKLKGAGDAPFNPPRRKSNPSRTGPLRGLQGTLGTRRSLYPAQLL